MEKFSDKTATTVIEGDRKWIRLGAAVGELIGTKCLTLHIRLLHFKAKLAPDSLDHLAAVAMHKLFHTKWYRLVHKYQIHTRYKDLLVVHDIGLRFTSPLTLTDSKHFTKLLKCMRIWGRWGSVSTEELILPLPFEGEYLTHGSPDQLFFFLEETEAQCEAYNNAYAQLHPTLIKPIKSKSLGKSPKYADATPLPLHSDEIAHTQFRPKRVHTQHNDTAMQLLPNSTRRLNEPLLSSDISDRSAMSQVFRLIKTDSQVLDNLRAFLAYNHFPASKFLQSQRHLFLPEQKSRFNWKFPQEPLAQVSEEFNEKTPDQSGSFSSKPETEKGADAIEDIEEMPIDNLEKFRVQNKQLLNKQRKTTSRAVSKEIKTKPDTTAQARKRRSSRNKPKVSPEDQPRPKSVATPKRKPKAKSKSTAPKKNARKV